MLEAKTRVEKLLWKYLDGKIACAAFQTALKRNFDNISISMAKEHVFGFDTIEFFLLLLTLLYIAMKFAVFGNGMTPKFTTATRLLANLELDTLLLFILR
jgi:hypothetical protein